MNHHCRSLDACARTGLACVSLSVAVGLAGCGGGPGEGSVTVSAESRARIVPHAGPNTKDAKGRPIATKPMSSKELVRGRAASGPQ
jgi:hypothetical protein